MGTAAQSYTAGLRAISITEHQYMWGEKMGSEEKKSVIMVGFAALTTLICMGIGYFAG